MHIPFILLLTLFLPTVVVPPITSYINPEPTVSTFLSRYHDFKDAGSNLDDYLGNGYRAMWCHTYLSGGESRVDYILTNRTAVDTVCMVEVGNKSLGRTLIREQESGYYLWHISTRTRGRQTVRPAFYLLLKPLPSHLEHVFYIRESEAEYLDHLETNTRLNYTLLTHSFYRLGNQLFVSSAYVRDRRLALGIPTTHSPLPPCISYHDLSFLNFTEQLARRAAQSFFPRSVCTYPSDSSSNDTRFAVIFERQASRLGTWFSLGLNSTTLATLIETSRDLYTPVLSLGYDHDYSEQFYIQFVNKRQDEL